MSAAAPMGASVQQAHLALARARAQGMHDEIAREAARTGHPAADFVVVLFAKEDVFVRVMLGTQAEGWAPITVAVAPRDAFAFSLDRFAQAGYGATYATAAARLRGAPPPGRVHAAIVAGDHLTTLTMEAPAAAR